MDRDATLSLLSHHKPGMQAQFGVRTLALFGSRARAQSRPDSDIDLLVEFDGPATSARYFGLQFFLEDLLGGRSRDAASLAAGARDSVTL